MTINSFLSRRWLTALAFSASCLVAVNAQEATSTVSEMTSEQIQQLSYNDLLQLSLEDLITVANKFGMSADEMLEYFLNKDIVAASKKAEKSMESPLSSTVISKEQIERSGVTNIPEALRLAPGVIVREKTPGNYDVHVRGYDNIPSNNILTYSENMLTLLMIDNRPVYSYAFGGTFWETLPIEVSDVERIEIIRGPSSALYGPNAVSGAINIITKKATSKSVAVSFDNALGNNNTNIANIASTFGIGNKLLARVSGNYQWNGRFQNDFFTFYDSRYHTQDFLEITKDKDGMYLKENASDIEPNPRRAGEKFGGNVALYYPVNDKVNFELAAGAQKSAVLTSMLGNRMVPFSIRESQTQYIDFKANAGGLQAQVNYMAGDQEYEKMVKGFHIDLQSFNANLEYDYKIQNLSLRPGVSYQQASYDDSKYVNTAIKEGYLNGKCVLSTVAAFMRADYTAFDKLRLVGAVRWDKYNKPDVTHMTYQFITSYKINDNHLVRGVYSRANRGPFMTDTYSDFTWQRIPGAFNILYLGNENLKLPVMDMIEFGYRVKPVKYIQADFEVFQTKTKDYSWFMPQSIAIKLSESGKPMMEGIIGYDNFDMTTTQIGFSGNIQIAVNKNLTMNVFGNIQKTELDHFYARKASEILEEMVGKLQTPDQPVNNEVKDADFVDQTHKSTPSYYGGGSVNYIFKEKWNINTSFYYYGKQTFAMTFMDTEIPAKTLVNAKVSYNFAKENKVFVNVRNLLNDDSNEFAFADQIGTKFFAGVQLNF
ncbi:iron complex outermembrane receptor protein [Breznakibacter xylanolyticus]|uniref:Iron complex outermembrane receptor protein n=1 Tax=Breznakibacter xylanolyticus TaxID=990 RepID=A0A2W7NMQ9_9BACT|nr:TonB-dependent receptor [Breznakibacter xylanolyticus]PZX19387.1 iron complex outermembrane receptor protein [Breznakibacter xylanolyticus]